MINPAGGLLLVFLAESLETLRHWYIIERLKKSPNKRLSFTIRGAFIAAASFLEYLFGPAIRPLWVTIPAFIMLSWVMHDYLLNVLRGVEPVWELNEKGPIDLLQEPEYVWFYIKLIALAGLVGAYLFNQTF